MYAPIGVLVRGCVPNFGRREWFYEKCKKRWVYERTPARDGFRNLTEVRDLENFRCNVDSHVRTPNLKNTRGAYNYKNEVASRQIAALTLGK